MKIFDTLTGENKEFKTVSGGRDVRMYSCGITVQDSPHIGHIRALMTADIVRRVLIKEGYNVTSVYNFTDIDDKLIDKMKNGDDYRILAQKNIDEFMKYLKILNVLDFTVYPRATNHIQEIIELIENLLKKGFAYQVNGDVFFRVSKFKEYGKLSGKNTDDLIEGKRVEVNESKENPLDFALWKSAKEGEPYWHSPFGKGRPGWHIECSAMSIKYLGETFDIHTGGEDLIFPHHENEIAQSECATGKTFANYWVHNGMVNLKGEKMSKSIGNVFKAKDILAKYHPNVVRLYLLKTQYRKSIEFSEERLDEAQSAFKRIQNVLEGEIQKRDEKKFYEKFREALKDDFNTPQALGYIFDGVNEINSKSADSTFIRGEIAEMLETLGFVFEKEEVKSHDSELIDLLIEIREDARNRKDFKLSDKIRDRLKEMNVTVSDSKEGARWKRED